MKAGEGILTRREFLKSAGLMGGAVLLSSFPAASPAAEAAEPELPPADPVLAGVCDLHVHAAPDTKERLIDELSFARAAKAAGYGCVMFKSNDWSCHDRVWLIREMLPGFEVFGSFCMNFCCGDRVNVYAAKAALRTTDGFCRCIWLPTQAADYQFKARRLPGRGIPVLDDSGKVLPEVVQVMELCAEADIILGSGHSSPEESLVLAAQAREVGLKKFVVTHANSGIWKMTHDQIRRAVDLGAFIEYSYITNRWGDGTGIPGRPRMSEEEFAAFVKIASEHSFISTDLGQTGMPHPITAMKECIRSMLLLGVTPKEIDLLVRRNPAGLVNLNV